LSSKNNINADHYKIRGRGRQGDGVVHSSFKRLPDQIKIRRLRGLSAKQLFERKTRLRAANQKQNRALVATHPELA
jgi:hypothetical protein